MTLLIRLILAHLIGDFMLQPKSWVEDKELKKIKSSKLYIHALIHGLLILILLWDINYWLLALAMAFLHCIIDILKIYCQRDYNKTTWFLLDQGLHVASIFILTAIWVEPKINLYDLTISADIWIYITAILFITSVSSVIMQVLMSNWSKAISENENDSLSNAGKYIGILERLFVFAFILIGRWEGVGFLLAAKSIFRFGDLKESKDRKLTEYILIGTLLSFAIATATGLVAIKLINIEN